MQRKILPVLKSNKSVWFVELKSIENQQKKKKNNQANNHVQFIIN